MEDSRIIQLLFERSEQGLEEVKQKYGKLILNISKNILHNEEDAKECENDTYLGIWNAIPPKEPNPLVAFVCKMARNVSLKKYRYNRASKRYSPYDDTLDELENMFWSEGSMPSAEEWSAKEMGKQINQFLATLKKEERVLFVKRYWFGESIGEIAAQQGTNENAISVKLFRIRQRLKKYLEKEGFYV